jgi:ABC-type branched-subunit amino acid transport system permease subunit
MEYYVVSIALYLVINVVLVLGMEVQFGFAGVLNFGYIAFVAIGAYVTAVTSMGTQQGVQQEYILHWSLPWPLPLLLAGLVSAVLGLVMAFLAMRRLRSDYLAISTIALSQVLWTVIGNDTALFNGWQGLINVPRPWQMDDAPFLLVATIIGLLIFFVCRQLYRSPLGRVWRTVRQDEMVAESFGRDAFRARVISLLVGCFIAGVGGGLLVEYGTSFSTGAWMPVETFFILAAVIVGGNGNYLGAILGAAVVLVLIGEGSAYIPQTIDPMIVESLRGVLTGLLLILVLKFKPAGLWPESSLRLYREPSPSLITAPKDRGADSKDQEAGSDAPSGKAGML